jgi:Uma2 family endonuclease
MVEAGILGEKEHVELLEGDLVEVPMQGPMHDSLTSELCRRLLFAYGDGHRVWCKKPLQASDHSLPEPDAAVVRDRDRESVLRFPRGEEALLAVEVACTSLALDRDKARIYARAGVPVYWLLDVEGRRLELHTEPSPSGRYEVITLLSEEKEIAPPGLEVRWRVGDLLP